VGKHLAFEIRFHKRTCDVPRKSIELDFMTLLSFEDVEMMAISPSVGKILFVSSGTKSPVPCFCFAAPTCLGRAARYRANPSAFATPVRVSVSLIAQL